MIDIYMPYSIRIYEVRNNKVIQFNDKLFHDLYNKFK